MRMFRWIAPLTIAAVVLLVSISASPFHSLKAAENGAQAGPMVPTAPSLGGLRAKLDQSDRQAAYQALQLALDEIGDGMTLIWKRPARGLQGQIKPVSAFRDNKGRVCRRILYSLSLGEDTKQVEDHACREADGSWTLAG
jgi:surface antigen